MDGTIYYGLPISYGEMPRTCLFFLGLFGGGGVIGSFFPPPPPPHPHPAPSLTLTPPPPPTPQAWWLWMDATLTIFSLMMTNVPLPAYGQPLPVWHGGLFLFRMPCVLLYFFLLVCTETLSGILPEKQTSFHHHGSCHSGGEMDGL